MASLSTLAVLALLQSSLANPVPLATPQPTTPPVFHQPLARQDTSSCGITIQPLTTITYSSLSQVSGTSWTSVGYDTMTFAEETVCTCGANTIGMKTTVDLRGTNHIYCVNTEGFTIATSVIAVPTGTPGDPENKGWQTVPCDYGEIVNGAGDVSQRWNDSSASAAWDQLQENWYEAGEPEDGFSNYAGNFFDWNDNPNCNLLTSPNCKDTITCGSAFAGGNQGETNSPAGMMIKNSFANINTVNANIYDAYEAARVRVLAVVGDLVTDFSPIQSEIDEQKKTKLIIDGVLGGVVFLTAPLLHFGLGKRVPFFSGGTNPNAFGTIVDSVYGSLGAGAAAYKDSMQALSPLPIQNLVEKTSGDIMTVMQKGIEETNAKMFGDPLIIGPLIDDGKFLELSPGNATDGANVMVKALVGSLLPSLWLTAKSPKWPAIITDDGLSGNTCEEKRIDSYGVTTPLREAPRVINYVDYVTDDAKVCGPDGSAYWLAGVQTVFEEPVSQVNVVSKSKYVVNIGTPGNIAALDGSKYGNLTKTELVLNGVNSNANNFQPPSATNPDFLNALDTGDLSKTWGLVKIPVCSMQQMTDHLYASRDNLENKSGNTRFPCPP